MKTNKNTTAPIVKSDRRKHRNEVILLISIASIVTAMLFLLPRENGTSVLITVDGSVFGEYALNENLTIEILTGDGKKQRNLVVIQDGKVSVTQASCPDGICKAHRPISDHGEIIICLPHRIVITVQASKSDTGPDIIV